MQQVAERVRREISADPHVGNCKIEVECVDGDVLLKGKVPTFYLKQMAQVAAIRVIDNTSPNGNGCPYLALTLQNRLDVEW